MRCCIGWMQHHRWMVIGATIVLLILAAPGMHRLHIDTDFQNKGWLTLTVIAICLLLAHGRLEPVLIIILPTAVSLPMTLGILGWLSVPVNQVNAAFVVFACILGIIYNVLLFASRQHLFLGRPNQSDTTLRAATICFLMTVIGCAVLILTHHPLLHTFGVTASVGLIVSFVTAVTWTPMLADLIINEHMGFSPPSLKHWIGGMIAYGFIVIMGVLYLFIRTFWFKILYRTDRQLLGRFARYWAHLTSKILITCFPYRSSRRRVIGVRGDEKPAIIVANHLAAIDIIYLLAQPWEMVMMAKRWVWRIPIMGLLVGDAGFLLVDTTTSLEQLTEVTRSHLDAGRFVTIFPEGMRSVASRIQRFRSGAFVLAEKTQADLLPIRLTNTQQCTPRHALWIGDHDMMIHVLPRIEARDMDPAQGHMQLARRVRDLIQAGTDSDNQVCAQGPALWQRLYSLYRYTGLRIEQSIYWRLKFDAMLRQLSQCIPACDTVLDLGCGYGLITNLLALTCPRHNMIGVDIDARKIHIAQHTARFVPNTRYHLENLRSWTMPSADVVLLIDVLGNWQPDDQRHMFMRATEAVRPGGRLVFRAHRNHRRGKGQCVVQAESYMTWARDAGLKHTINCNAPRGGTNHLLIFTHEDSGPTGKAIQTADRQAMDSHRVSF